MPLAEKAAHVLRIFYHLIENRNLPVERNVVLPGAVRMRVESRQERAPGWGADGLCDIERVEDEAPSCQGVEVGRVDLRIAVGFHRVDPLLIREKDEQILMPAGLRGRYLDRGCQHQGKGEPTTPHDSSFQSSDRDQSSSIPGGSPVSMPPPTMRKRDRFELEGLELRVAHDEP